MANSVKLPVIVTRVATVEIDGEEIVAYLERWFRRAAADHYEEAVRMAEVEQRRIEEGLSWGTGTDPEILYGQILTNSPLRVLEALLSEGKGPAFLRTLDPDRGETWDIDYAEAGMLANELTPEQWSRLLGRSVSAPSYEEAKSLSEARNGEEGDPDG